MTDSPSSATVPGMAAVSSMATVYPGFQAMPSSVFSVKVYIERTSTLSLGLESHVLSLGFPHVYSQTDSL